MSGEFPVSYVEGVTPLTESEKISQAEQYWQEKLQNEERIGTPQLQECKCAIVVPVYNEDVRRIQKQLDSLLSQSINPEEFEVIYVVNNDVADSDTITKNVRANNKLVIDYIHSLEGVSVFVIDKSSSGSEIIDCNVGKARNRGVAEASLRFYENGKNGIIIQTDADTYFEDERHLEKVFAAFNQSPEVVGIAGGLVFEFNPDSQNQEEREALSLKINRLLQMKIWKEFQAFLTGDHNFTTKDNNFSGAHMLSRSFETAVIGGLADDDYGEDSQFGIDLTQYANCNQAKVIGMKDDIKVITALRDSDRTPASFKTTLDAIDLTQPLVIDGNVITDDIITECEKLILTKEGGSQLIDYMRKSLHLLRLGS